MLKIAFNQDLDRQNQWHFVPVKLTGGETMIPNAKVENYFKPNIKKEACLTNSFQGHLLKGVESNQTELYRGICYKSEDKEGDRQIVITERVGQAVDWRKDVPWQ